MKVLILGATGATGRLVVNQLLLNGHEVNAFLRSGSEEKLAKEIISNPNLYVIPRPVLEMSDKELEKHLEGCGAIISTLGHNLTFRGVYGPPRQLVTDSIQKLTKVIQNRNNSESVRMILMSTVGCKNEDLQETRSFSARCVFFLLRYLVPPHSDNEKAVNYLQSTIGQNRSTIDWVAVRPDTLTNEADISPYAIYASPIHSLFKPGKTSRINVAHFIAELISNKLTWSQWKGQMPVVYNAEFLQ